MPITTHPVGPLLSGGQAAAAVATKEAALAKIVAHLSEHAIAFRPVGEHIRGMSPEKLAKSVFLKYLHDVDGKFIVYLNTHDLVTPTLELTLDKATGRFESIYKLDCFSRRASHNLAPAT